MIPPICRIVLVYFVVTWQVTTMGALGFSSDVSRYLATKTRYLNRLPIPNAPSAYSLPDPPGYVPSHFWLLARHGTRWPTYDRTKQIQSMENVFKDASNTHDYPWMKGWKSPIHTYYSGELHPIGEDELWGLAKRLRRRYPTILRNSYLPNRYPVVSTQVPRTSASAYAFAAGFFPQVPSHEILTEHNAQRGWLSGGNGDEGLLGQLLQLLTPRSGNGAGDEALLRRPQAVAINMAPKTQDPLLRFFDMCPAYAQREHWLEQWLASWMEERWGELAVGIGERMGMTRSMTGCEVEALWTLCQYEAGLQGIRDRACALLSPADVLQLEWLDDVNLLESHGPGSPINYNIAAPLLQDLRASLQAAADASFDDPSAVHARLLFAHCETLVPLATLLGMFQPDLPPTPLSAQLPPAAELELKAPVDEARNLLASVDTIQDLSVHLPGLKEGVDGCKHGVPSKKVPHPEGWYPRTPFNNSRVFRGGRVSPFGANMAIVLYKAAGPAGSRPAHRLRLLYNEQVMAIPNCKPIGEASASDPGAALDCDLEDFLAVTKTIAGGEETLERWCQPVDAAVAAAAA